MPVDYSKGQIYKIVSDNSERVYYGSTTQKLYKRIQCHADNYKRFLEGKQVSNYTSYKVLADGNYSIVLVEKFPCEDKSQLLEREKFYIKNNACVNRNVPNRTQKEYRIDNKDKIVEDRRNRYEENTEIIKQQSHDYYHENIEAIKEKKK